MSVLAAAMIGGTALSIYGQIKGNLDQADAERENAAWLQEQADFYQRTADRDMDIVDEEADTIQGQQRLMAVSSGLEMSGSVAQLLMATEAAARDEKLAIADNARMEIRGAGLRARQASKRADTLGSFGHNFLQASTTATSSAPSIVGEFKK